jgi:hypothetical protein
MVLMQTAGTCVKNPKSSVSQQVRVLMDCGSQRTFITQRLADALVLNCEKEENISLITFGNENPTVIKTKSTNLCLKLTDGTFMENYENWKQLVKSLDLADTIPNENEQTSIELLFGNDYYLDIIMY